MNAFVVDTNVPVVANGQHPEAGYACRLACVKRIREIQCDGMVVIDDAKEILREYKDNLSFSGQPGVGDQFFRWIWDHHADSRRCERVPLGRPDEDSGDYAGFPRTPELKQFDKDDRKFVAVALGSRNAPAVLNATDSDWWDFRDVLAREGVRIEFVCPAYFREE